MATPLRENAPARGRRFFVARTLILVRHAKSDWSAPVDDQHRPLARRGRRQAPATGRWLAQHLPAPDLVLVSVAVRAQQTWELLASELPELSELPRDAPVRSEDAVYTFSRDTHSGVGAHRRTVRHHVQLAGANSAFEELPSHRTAPRPPPPSAALPVADLREGGARQGPLRAFKRPAEERVTLGPGANEPR